MTSKERMLTALKRGMPDRVPATVHQWQYYHLKYYMGGKTSLQAFLSVGLDAAVEIWANPPEDAPQWKVEEKRFTRDGDNYIQYTVHTPEGDLEYEMGFNEITTWVTRPIIKKDEDIYLLKKYQPIPVLDKEALSKAYDELGDNGIMRGGLCGNQAGCWQDACVLYGTQEMIYATFDKPDWVHEFMEILLEKRFQYIEQNLHGAKFDLIETGGGAASNNVISPAIHKEFCLPYDKRMHDAVHAAGFPVTYHTCGGMMKLLDIIPENGCDASETLSPPGVGGDITEPDIVKQKLGSRVVLIGGLDQFNILTNGSPEAIRKEVRRLFEAYGKNGGYIMSVCDHFFDAPVENLKAYAEAAKECTY